MATMSILGGPVYNTPDYKAFWNKQYENVAAMRASVDKLKASKLIDMKTMEYGQYQPVLVPLADWPSDLAARIWLKEVGQARLHLTAQSNSTPLSKDEPNVVPLTRCALLDACIRKCFNSDPPIPMTIDMGQQPIDSDRADQHEIILVWEYGNGNDQPPTRLNLKMICPYRAVVKP